eukprot:m.598309 g.598309  ORF g.598309 m.598309 type:complete len:931 (-) comp58075_c0_seq1:70-2862(-)
MERRNSLPGLTSTPRVKKFAVLEDLSGSMDASIDRVPSLGGSELSKSFAFGQGRISPLDRIRPLRPGFDGQAPDEPMSLNATMPNMPHLRHEELIRGGWNLAGKGLDTLSFSPATTAKAPTPGFAALSASFVGMSSSWASQSMLRPSSVLPQRNPQKAMITVDHCGTILIANDLVCELLEFQTSELIGTKMSKYISSKAQHHGAATEDVLVKDDGTLQAVSGRVMTLVTKSQCELPVSVWLKPIAAPEPDQHRFLVFLEKVARYTGQLAWNASGVVVYHDKEFASLNGYGVGHALLGRPLSSIFNSGDFTSESSTIQHITCRTPEGVSFPATLETHAAKKEDLLHMRLDASSTHVTVGDIFVYGCMSGIVSLDTDGKIFGFNETFVALMFGRNAESVKNADITVLIPKFFQDTRLRASLSPNPPSNAISLNCSLDSTTSTLNQSTSTLAAEDHRRHSTASSTSSQSLVTTPGAPLAHQGLPSISEASATGFVFPNIVLTPSGSGAPQNTSQLSTASNPPLGSLGVLDGSYHGQGIHANASVFEIAYDVKRIRTQGQEDVYCIWISRDDTASLEAGIREFAASQPHDLNATPTADDPSLSGEFERRFDVLEKLGTGAFGSVQLVARKSDNMEFVVKVVKKAKVLQECWELNDGSVHMISLAGDPYAGKLPREVMLLTKLAHRNIVKIVEVYHNLEFFQLLMERDGPTFDLFEFIDHNPDVDESIASHIFRQVVSAVDYLHDRQIVHRDIKDENIILDFQLRAKLIDFGSAAYMQKGKLFDTFCGTLEYCAPEVLLGNPYPGPELEVFSMGVTLFTLVFGENPFFDVEETIAGSLRPPFQPGHDCFLLIQWLLEPNPRKRVTVKQLVTHPWLNKDVSRKVQEVLLAWEAKPAAEDPDASNIAPEDSEDEFDEIQAQLYEGELRNAHKLNKTM